MSQSNSDPLARRRPASQQRAKILVKSVRDAARKILETEGPAALNTNRVAEIAGVSVGSVYHYFPNKDSIVADLFEDVVDQLTDEISSMGQQVEFAEMPLDQALENFVRLLFEHRGRLVGLHCEFLEKWGSRFEVNRRRAPDGRTYGEVTHDWVVELLRLNRDVVEVDDLDAAAYGISLLAEGFGRACWEERLPDQSLERLGADLSRAMLAYIGFDPGRASSDRGEAESQTAVCPPSMANAVPVT